MIQIDAKTCIGCGQCVDECFSDSLQLENGKAVHAKPCILCGHCFALCPTGAITMPNLPDGDPDSQRLDPTCPPVDARALLQLIRFRRSTRYFKPEPLKPDDLHALLETARYSPTGGNIQGLRFILLEERLPDMSARAAAVLGAHAAESGYYGATMRAIAQAAENGQDRLFFHAPHVLLIVQKNNLNENDAGIAAGRIELMAAALAVGVCFNGFFARAVQLDADLRADLNISDDETLMLTLALGYPDIRYLRCAPRNPIALTRY